MAAVAPEPAGTGLVVDAKVPSLAMLKVEIVSL